MKSDQNKSSVTLGLSSESILINQTRIFLNFETQISKLGRPFRLSGTKHNLNLPGKWINKELIHHTIHSFIYLDEQAGFFEVEIGYNNEFISLTKC